MPTNSEVIVSGVGHYATGEVALMDAIKAISDLVVDWDNAYANDMIKQGKYLKIRAKLISIAGDISKSYTELLETHELGTAMAKANNCDVPAAYSTGGGISILGGGR